jgi:lysozyme
MIMIDAVIDLSHHNSVTSFAAVRAAGVLALFHKATQGGAYADPTFASRRADALGAGLLFGAYHFGTGGAPLVQADHFVATAGADHPLVLDFESNPSGDSMTLAEAEQFVARLFALTGRYPGLYSGDAVRSALAHAAITQARQTILSRCWLWIAEYAPAPVVPAVWNNWTLWQHTDGDVGPEPHGVDGVGACDRDKFNGSQADLRAFWQTQSRQPS